LRVGRSDQINIQDNNEEYSIHSCFFRMLMKITISFHFNSSIILGND